MNKHIVGALFWIFFGVVYLICSLQYEAGQFNAPQAGFFPRVVGYLIILCGVLVLISSLRKRKREKPPEGVFEGANPRYLRSAGLVVLITAIYIGILDSVGFLVASPLLIFFLGWTMGGRNWIANILTSISFSAAIYYTFWVIMRTPIPLGTLWGY